MAEVISISNATRVHSYRGVLIVTDKLSVEAGSRVSLSGYVSDGGTSDVFTICRLLDAPMSGKPFILGNCSEIVKIPFDSSCLLGVKLYNCENKRINVNSIEAAFITLDTAFQSPMTVNKETNRLEYIFSQNDYKYLSKAKYMI
uniref:Uncharacterized protein n=1 Tax=Salmonella phage FelixO1 TaxID=77775 RepID=O80228_9CAUD|nr:unknown [Salmonella phage FelixO1]